MTYDLIYSLKKYFFEYSICDIFLIIGASYYIMCLFNHFCKINKNAEFCTKIFVSKSLFTQFAFWPKSQVDTCDHVYYFIFSVVGVFALFLFFVLFLFFFLNETSFDLD